MANFGRNRYRSRLGRRAVPLAFRALAAVAVTGGLVAGSARADTRGGVDAFISVVPNPLPGAQSTTPALWGWIGNRVISIRFQVEMSP